MAQNVTKPQKKVIPFTPKKTRELSFAVKVMLMISVPFCLITSGIVFLIYFQSKDIILEQMSNRLKNVGRAGALLFTPQHIEDIKVLNQAFYDNHFFRIDYLSALDGADGIADTDDDETFPAIEEQTATKIMESPEFQRIVQLMRTIRSGTRSNLYVGQENMEPLHIIRKSSSDLPTINFLYLMTRVPKESGAVAQQDSSDNPVFYDTSEIMAYLADADYLPVQDDGTGEPYEGNPIGNIFYPLTEEMSQSFDTKFAIAEREFPGVDQWGDVQISGYTPILDENRKIICVMGIDYNINSEANRLALLRNICLAAGIGSLVLSLFLALFIRGWIHAPISALIRGANQVSQKNFETHIDIKSNDEMGNLARAFNTMITEIKDFSEHLQKLNTAFEKFVPKEFLLELKKRDILDVQIGDQVQREMTVLFANLNYATTQSERILPVERLEFLNSFLAMFSPIVKKNQGFIDKFLGFIIMALFPQSETNALISSIEIQQQINTLNFDRNRKRLPLISATMGLHFGKLIMGTVGNANRMDSTVISDAVNLASRLEGMARKFKVKIICSDSVIGTTKAIAGLQIYSRYLGHLRVKGKTERVRVHEVFNADDDEEKELKIMTQNKFENAVEALHVRKDFPSALQIFKDVLKVNPTDSVAQMYCNGLQSRWEKNAT